MRLYRLTASGGPAVVPLDRAIRKRVECSGFLETKASSSRMIPETDRLGSVASWLAVISRLSSIEIGCSFSSRSQAAETEKTRTSKKIAKYFKKTSTDVTEYDI